jgi:1-acyl-sn-glycerol-3-phosphate acyltransferase
MNATYAIGYWASRIYFDLFHAGETTGIENIPRTGPFILAANHASFFDPPAIGSRLPRPSHYFARKTLFKPGLKGDTLRRVNAIPVDLESDSDVGALKAVFRLLKEDGGILLFPEGTRSSDGLLQPARAGVGMIACKSGAPVVPTRIFGSFEAFGRHDRRPRVFSPMHVAFAPALLPCAYDIGGKTKERYQIASDRIMQAIAAIPPPPASHV